jgi:hypothetical protein
LLSQIAAVFQYSFRLMFLYVCSPLACMECINLIFTYVHHDTIYEKDQQVATV